MRWAQSLTCPLITRPAVYGFFDIEGRIYLLCDAGATSLSIWNALEAVDQSGLGLDQVNDFLESLVAARLVYKEDGLYLSLATSDNIDAVDLDEPRRANEPGAIAPVQIMSLKGRRLVA